MGVGGDEVGGETWLLWDSGLGKGVGVVGGCVVWGVGVWWVAVTGPKPDNT